MIKETFRSLNYKNYRLFFIGQFFSLIGLWIQNVGQQWLIWEITHSTFYIGLFGFLSTIPILFISLFAGAIADKYSKLKLNFIIQSVAMLQALVLGLIVYFNKADILNVGILVLILGVINSFEIPIRQSFTIEMVGKSDLQNAIGLNSTIFNLSRLIGPAIAGIIILKIGIAWCFLLNSISFFAILIMFLFMDKDELHRTTPQNLKIINSIKIAFKFLKDNKNVLNILFSVAVVTIFGWNYSVILPEIADHKYKLGAVGLSQLYTANSIGALISAVFIASTSKRISSEKIMIYSFILFVISSVIFSFSDYFIFNLISISGMGMGLIGFFVSANSTFQSKIPHELRGRLLGFYVLIFQGLNPFGNLFIGSLSKITSVQFSLIISVSVCSILFYLINKKKLQLN